MDKKILYQKEIKMIWVVLLSLSHHTDGKLKDFAGKQRLKLKKKQKNKETHCRYAAGWIKVVI